jgi:toxin CcdB
MARYDVHASSDGYFYVEIQASSLEHLNTRVVIPLMPLDVAPVPARHLNPIFHINGQTLALVTQYLGTARVSTLGPVVASLANEQDRISAALDRLFYGF